MQEVKLCLQGMKHTHTKEGLHQQRSMRIHAGGFIWSWTKLFLFHTDSQSKHTFPNCPTLPTCLSWLYVLLCVAVVRHPS